MGGLFSFSSPPLEVASRNILITGASSGIGEEMARKIASEGGNLALVARNTAKLEEVAEECRQLGSETVRVYSCDLTKNAEIEKATTEALKDFTTFDIVVLNAGRSQGCYFEEVKDIDQIDYMMKLNVSGVIIPLQKLLPSIPKKSTSRIVVVSSSAGLIPVLYRTVYSASKAAVIGFCKSLRLELVDTYGEDAPKVCLINAPEIATPLNDNRMDFGAQLPPMQFKAGVAGKLDENVAEALNAIRRGDRSWGEPLKVMLILTLCQFIPRILDASITRYFKRTSFRPTITQS